MSRASYYEGLENGQQSMAEELSASKAEVELLRSEIARFRERFVQVDRIKSISEQREEAWAAICDFDIYFEQALKTGGGGE